MNWTNRGEPVFQTEGSSVAIPWTVYFKWASTVDSVTAVEVYRDGSATDEASTFMPSWAEVISGKYLTLKPLTDLAGGEYYIVTMYVTVDGVDDAWHHRVGAKYKHTGKM